MLFHDENSPFSVESEKDFSSLALELFRFQAGNNKVYKKYLNALNIKPGDIETIGSIPFLPISFFKNSKVVVGESKGGVTFRSSGTTGPEQSVHYVKTPEIYERSFLKSFEKVYGNPGDITIYALLPSYLERKDSSLVFMVDRLIRENKNSKGGFFLNNHDDLLEGIIKSRASGEKVLLGVSFALLDLVEHRNPDLAGVIVMETGGMKGRRKEMIREELHSVLMKGMNIDTVHSEYGMTELLSQAWSEGDGIFKTPPWMKIITRDPLDPFSLVENGRTGGINIIDLANIYSCSFIETSDLGIINNDGTFEVTGRFDASDVRGCNLLI